MDGVAGAGAGAGAAATGLGLACETGGASGAADAGAADAATSATAARAGARLFMPLAYRRRRRLAIRPIPSVPEHDLGDAATAAGAGQLDEHVDGAADIMAHVLAVELGAALEDEEDDLLDRPLRAVGVDGGHRAGVAGIDRAEEGIGLLAA